MHDLDRIMAEIDAGEVDAGEGHFDGEDETFGDVGETTVDEILEEAGDYETDGYEVEPQGEDEFLGFETDFEADQEDAPLSEIEEMTLATQLLEVGSDEELDQFLGKLLKRAMRRVGRVGRAFGPLGKVLKAVARRALPVVGGALGTAFGGPLGGALGGRIASGAGRIFGLEIEGLSAEDQEYQVARRFVRFASDAATRAARAGGMPPNAAVRNAVHGAARRFAPGLLRGGKRRARSGRRRQRGVWVRRGRAIVLLGV